MNDRRNITPKSGVGKTAMRIGFALAVTAIVAASAFLILRHFTS
jgi:hypothetical protein